MTGRRETRKLTSTEIVRLHGLFAEHVGGLAAYLRRWVPRTDIEDVVQDLWVKILEGKFTGGHTRGWLFSVARNHAIDLYKKHRPEALGDSDESLSDGENPLQDLLATEKFQVLEECFKKLDNLTASVLRGKLAGTAVSALAAEHRIEAAEASRVVYRGKAALQSCVQKHLSS